MSARNSRHSTFQIPPVTIRDIIHCLCKGLDKIGAYIVSQRVVKLYPQQVCQDSFFVFLNQKCGG